MKSQQLEILLFTDTHFSSRQFSEKYTDNNQSNSSKNKHLEQASWDGLFKEILPELYMDAENNKYLVLWKIIKGEHFLDLEYGEHPQVKDWRFSIDPYYFLRSKFLS